MNKNIVNNLLFFLLPLVGILIFKFISTQPSIKEISIDNSTIQNSVDKTTNTNYKEVNFNVKNSNDDKVNLYAQDFSYYNDFDKDGKADLITYGVQYGDSANQGDRQKFGPTIWFNTTQNGYSSYTLLHDNVFYRKYQGFGKLNMTASMVIYDYDNDGYKDVILNNINANGSPYKDHNSLIIVWKNLGNGQFKNVTENVFNVGALGIENINKLKLLKKALTFLLFASSIINKERQCLFA